MVVGAKKRLRSIVCGIACGCMVFTAVPVAGFAGENELPFEEAEIRTEPLSGSLRAGDAMDEITKNLGNEITLTAEGKGGSSGYTYKFAVYNEVNGKWSVLRDFSEENTYTYALNYAGRKQFAVSVKDSSGTVVATNRLPVVVVDNRVKFSASLTGDGTTEDIVKLKGEKISLTAKGENGTGEYTYQFAVCNMDTGKWSVLRKFSDDNTYTYTLGYTGQKQFAVTVKDSSGVTVATNRITVMVCDAPKLAGTLSVDNLTQELTKKLGEEITLTAAGSGGSQGYTYRFAVYNVDTEKWSVLRDFDEENTYTYALNYAGTKEFAVTVKDSRGVTVAANRIRVKVVK